MPRAHDFPKRRFGGHGMARKTCGTPRIPGTTARPAVAAVEDLENRRLLSATVVNPGGPVVIVPHPPVTPVPVVPVGVRSYGVTLQLKAGQAFNGYLGVLIGPKVPAGDKLSASIDWGDGSQAGAGVVLVSNVGHIDVGGAHTYAKAGNYSITVSVTAAPVPVPGQPTPTFVILLGTIGSKAVVSPANSTGGVTIRETAGVAFTATVGTFSDIAPATNLHASINWGDGTAPSAGTITATGVSGVDVINFKVDGSHTYAKAASFPIVVTVTQNFSPPGSLAPIRLIATIDSTAVVTPKSAPSLDGTIAGTYKLAPTIPDAGAVYVFTGTGKAGALGPVGASGTVNLPGFIPTGQANGTLKLTSASATAVNGGSVTLKLTGPTEQGFGPFPGTLAYVITGGSGAFTNASGSGTIDVTLVPKTQVFTFVIHSG